MTCYEDVPEYYRDEMLLRYGNLYGFPSTSDDHDDMVAWTIYYWETGKDLRIEVYERSKIVRHLRDSIEESKYRHSESSSFGGVVDL